MVEPLNIAPDMKSFKGKEEKFTDLSKIQDVKGVFS